MSDRLEPTDVRERLAAYPQWKLVDGALERAFDRTDFNGSMAFVNAIAERANALDHHPDLAISWNDVIVRVSSHDVGGISDRDFALIAAIDDLAAASKSG